MKFIFNVKRNYLNGKSGRKKQNKYSLSKQSQLINFWLQFTVNFSLTIFVLFEFVSHGFECLTCSLRLQKLRTVGMRLAHRSSFSKEHCSMHFNINIFLELKEHQNLRFEFFVFFLICAWWTQILFMCLVVVDTVNCYKSIYFCHRPINGKCFHPLQWP